MALPGITSKPTVTLPDVAKDELVRVYTGASVILEYGSGGSTVLASELPNKRIFSVESDANWAKGMAEWFETNPPLSPVVMHHADIGPTGKWGRPTDKGSFLKWPGYALSIWESEGFVHPDVILIDGRFRPSCFLAAAVLITKPVTVLFDDYLGRTWYHVVEDLVKPAAFAGRMARFQLEPQKVPVHRLRWFMEQFLNPE